eukprot:3327049-Pyramimonas_sp.AAC.1
MTSRISESDGLQSECVPISSLGTSKRCTCMRPHTNITRVENLDPMAVRQTAAEASVPPPIQDDYEHDSEAPEGVDPVALSALLLPGGTCWHLPIASLTCLSPPSAPPIAFADNCTTPPHLVLSQACRSKLTGVLLGDKMVVLLGWVKQRSPACAAASIAGSWNAVMGLSRGSEGALDQVCCSSVPTTHWQVTASHDAVVAVFKEILRAAVAKKRERLERILGADPLPTTTLSPPFLAISLVVDLMDAQHLQADWSSL